VAYTDHGSAAAGWDDLRDGRWEAARAAFGEAGGEGPEALEGLSWAAWWLDDGPAVFAARERAYRLYRRRGEAAGAARMATWLAADELDFHGAWPVASGWLARAQRLLEPLEPGPEHGWLAFHEGFIAHANGDTARAQELAAAATEAGRRLGVADLEMLGLALEGASLVACAEVGAGMRCLDEATATALEGGATIPISGAWTFCFLVSACTAVLDFERASSWCDRIAAFAERYGSRYMLAFCRAEYGAVHLWRGRWAEAEAMLEASVEDFTCSRPAWVAGPLATLAELRRRQGRRADAASLLERAGAGRSAQLCRARIGLDDGEPRRAVDLLERLLRTVPDQRGLERAPALELLVHAWAAHGEPAEGAAALARLRRVERRVATPALTACADLADGVLLAAGGTHERARVRFEDAVDGFTRSGAPFEAAGARLELAATLLALGRAPEAAAEAAAARDRLLALGAAPEADRARRVLAACGADDGGGAREPLTPREREVCACSPAASRTGRSPSGWW
jgi:LuxR family maltose regulon positive regulatory protein